MGSYHGRHTFDQLSHLRSCLIKQLKMETVNAMRYPPHTAKKMGWARFFLLKQVNVCRLQRMALLATLIGLAAFVVQVRGRISSHTPNISFSWNWPLTDAQRHHLP